MSKFYKLGQGDIKTWAKLKDNNAGTPIGQSDIAQGR
jgi:hypothetical protein